MGSLEPVFILALVATTTLISYVSLKRVRPQDARRAIVEALGALLDWAGLFAIFFAANAAVGAVVILLIRGLTPRFVGLYALEDLLLLILSAAQAFVFRICWRRD